MIEELKLAIKKAEELSEDEQREIARILDIEMQWQQTLNKTQGLLGRLADDALNEHRSGETNTGDW